MAQALPDAIITDYEHVKGDLRLPDPDDRHVLAAAIIGRGDTIITQNLSDFPHAALVPHGRAAQHPDTFLAGLYERRPAEFQEAVRTIRARLVRPPFTVAQYLELLARRGLTNTAERLRQDGRHL